MKNKKILNAVEEIEILCDGGYLLFKRVHVFVEIIQLCE